MSNKSFWNNSQNAPGFVYFDTTPTSPQHQQSSKDTADFLAFNDSPKQFNPPNYSSPQKHHSPRNHNFQQRNWKQNRFSGHQHSRNRNSWGGNRHDISEDGQKNGDFDESRYLHPSFTEDPWAELEDRLNISARNSSSKDFTSDR